MTRSDVKTLDVLDEKIKRAVDLVGRLKSENAELSDEVETWKSKAQTDSRSSRELEKVRASHEQLSDDHASLSREHDGLTRKMSQLQDERQAMLDRVDGLLSKLDALDLD